MNILMICYNLLGQGTYLRAYEFARVLVEKGHSATLMATSSSRKLTVGVRFEYGIRIVETPDFFPGSLRSGWNPLTSLARINWLQNQEFDLIHAFESRPTCVYPAMYLKKKGIPLIFDWSDWFGRGGSVEERPNRFIRLVLTPIETYFENHFRPLADANTVISTTLYKKISEMGKKSQHIAIIPNGFDVPGWKVHKKQIARQALSISADGFIVGYIGSLFPGDAILMAKASSLLRDRIPKFKLLHIGRSNYHLPPSPEFIQTGFVSQDELSLYLSACDLCWLPLSDTKANRSRFPLKFSYYLAAGKSVVVTDVGDIADYVEDEDLGLICKPTPEEIANKVYQMRIDTKLRQLCGENARKLSNDLQYSWKARTDQVLDVYRQITGD